MCCEILGLVRDLGFFDCGEVWSEAMSSAPSTLAVEKAFGIYQALMLGWYRWY